MAEKREDRFSWKKGDVEITLPNGKKLDSKKNTSKKASPKKK